jgi:hypothetical protein
MDLQHYILISNKQMHYLNLVEVYILLHSIISFVNLLFGIFIDNFFEGTSFFLYIIYLINNNKIIIFILIQL